MRSSDWSSDVCSADLHERQSGVMPGAVSQLAGPPYGRRRMDSGVDNKKQRRPWLKWLNRLITVAFIVLVAWLVISRAPSVDWAKVMRSVERRVGKEWVSTCRSRLSLSH